MSNGSDRCKAGVAVRHWGMGCAPCMVPRGRIVLSTLAAHAVVLRRHGMEVADPRPFDPE